MGWGCGCWLVGTAWWWAQSFDCKLAKTDVEKAVCASKELSVADSARAAEYKQMLGEIPADAQVDPVTVSWGALSAFMAKGFVVK